VKRARGSIMLYTNKEIPRVPVVYALWDGSDLSWIPLPRNASFRASTVWILAVCSDLETEVKEGMEFFCFLSLFGVKFGEFTDISFHTCRGGSS
jgi:hypothetical protein